MTDTPKNGDLGVTAHGGPRIWQDGAWYHFDGGRSSDQDVVSSGKRAVPIDVCEWAVQFVKHLCGEELKDGDTFDGRDIRATLQLLAPPTPKEDA